LFPESATACITRRNLTWEYVVPTDDTPPEADGLIPAATVDDFH